LHGELISTLSDKDDGDCIAKRFPDEKQEKEEVEL
jgi:hypothetical protein